MKYEEASGCTHCKWRGAYHDLLLVDIYYEDGMPRDGTHVCKDCHSLYHKDW